jgi:hypothetical protein
MLLSKTQPRVRFRLPLRFAAQQTFRLEIRGNKLPK